MPAWVLMTDEVRLADPSALVERLPPGSAVIVRDRDPARRTMTVCGLRAVCRARGVFVAEALTGVPDRLYGDSLHIPEHALGSWRRVDLVRLQPALVTASAHSRGAAVRAFKLGVDAVLLSPVFATRSHPGGAYLGLMRFSAIARQVPLPVIALGGIGLRDVERLREAGATGIAGIGLFAEAPEAG